MDSPDNLPNYASKLAVLREEFRESMRDTFTGLGELIKQLHAESTSLPILEAIRREMHRLYGTAGSYGYMDASDLAGEMEQRVIAWLADQELEPASRGAIMSDFLKRLEQSFSTPSIL